jgi:hypothetical protein
VEVCGAFGLNLRVNRYYIYFIPFLFYYLLSLVKNWEEKNLYLRLSFLILGLSFYSVFFYSPWGSYLWDDDHVKEFKKIYPINLNQERVIICSNAYQAMYYFNRPFRDCRSEAESKLKRRESFIFFNLNQSNKDLTYYLLSKGKIQNVMTYGHAISFEVNAIK